MNGWTKWHALGKIEIFTEFRWRNPKKINKS
jgi:hypothetical protein